MFKSDSIKLIYFYFTLSIFMVLLSYIIRIKVPYDYNENMPLNFVVYNSSYIFFGLLIMNLVNFILNGRHVSVVYENINFRSQLSIFFKLAQSKLSKVSYALFFLFFIFYLLLKANGAVNEYSENFYVGNFRPFSSKFSFIFLLYIGLGVVVFENNNKIKNYIFFFCLILAYMYSYIDASRSAVLLLIGSFLLFIAKNKIYKVIFLGLYCVFLSSIALFSRSVYGRLDFETFSSVHVYVTDNLLALFLTSLTYFTGFSLFQFSFVDYSGLGYFTSEDLLYSITPIPTLFLGEIPDYSNWAVGQNIPMGAFAEIFRVSVVYFYLFFVYLGWLTYLIDRIENGFIKIILALVLLFAFSSSFQYNLRSVQWYFHALFLISMFILIKERRKNTA